MVMHTERTGPAEYRVILTRDGVTTAHTVLHASSDRAARRWVREHANTHAYLPALIDLRHEG